MSEDAKITAAIVAAIVSLVVAFISPAIGAGWRRHQNKVALRGELLDLMRHLATNSSVIDKVKSTADLALYHYQMLMIPDTGFLPSKLNIGDFPPHMINDLYSVALSVRNYNFVVSCIVEKPEYRTDAVMSDLSRRCSDLFSKIFEMYYNFFPLDCNRSCADSSLSSETALKSQHQCSVISCRSCHGTWKSRDRQSLTRQCRLACMLWDRPWKGTPVSVAREANESLTIEVKLMGLRDR